MIARLWQSKLPFASPYHFSEPSSGISKHAQDIRQSRARQVIIIANRIRMGGSEFLFCYVLPGRSSDDDQMRLRFVLERVFSDHLRIIAGGLADPHHFKLVYRPQYLKDRPMILDPETISGLRRAFIADKYQIHNTIDNEHTRTSQLQFHRRGPVGGWLTTMEPSINGYPGDLYIPEHLLKK